MNKSFQVYCCVQNPRSHVLVHFSCFESDLHEEICCNFTWVQNFKFTHFQNALHDNSNTWADAGPLKVKYLVNARNFKHILKRHPIINYKFFKCRQILKARAFE